MRWGYLTRQTSPFNCDYCSAKQRVERNCSNHLNLSIQARAISAYTKDVKEELKNKKALKVFTLGDIRLYECPVSYLEDDILEVIRLVYMIDSSGHLLHAGGLGAQPAWLIEAFELYRIEKIRNLKDNE